MSRNRISTGTLAKICGVSQGTVDRALNNRKGINKATKEKILAVAKEYGYRPNIHASCMAGGRSKLIGVIVFDFNNQYFSDIVANIEKHCAEKGYSVVIMFTNKDGKKEIECIEKLYSMSVDGIIISPCNEGKEFENYLMSLEIPVVTIANKLEKFPYVGIDNDKAMCECTEFVIDSGYESLVYVKPPLGEKNVSAQSERLSAFTNVCQRRGVAYKVVGIGQVDEEIWRLKNAAIICPTDKYAIRLFSSAQKSGLGIIGFDNISIIDLLGIKLDSVAYDVEQTAMVATDYIIEGKEIVLPINHIIVKRNSI